LQINHLAKELYHYLLLKHPAGKKALDYLKDRGISLATIKEFGLGYAPLKYDLLEQFLVGKKGFEKDEVLSSGLVFKNDRGQLTDRFRDRIMFPLADYRDNILGFSGRIITPQDNVGKYINTPETPLYHKSQLLFGLDKAKEAIRQEKKVIVVEGEFDMISPYQAGIKNIVAIKGTALTGEQVNLLRRFAEEILLALDEDAAGQAASRRGIELATNAGLNVKVVTLGKRFKDPDEAVRGNLPLFKARVKNAIPIYDFYILSAAKRFDVSTAWGKKQASDELAPILGKIEDEVLRSHYLELAAEKLAVPVGALLNKTASFSVSGQEEEKDQFFKEEEKGRQEILGDYLFSLCFQYHEEAFLLTRNLGVYLFSPAQKRLRRFLKQYLKEKEKFSSKEFYQFLPSELREIFNHYYLTPLSSHLADRQLRRKEIEKTIADLKVSYWREKINHLSQLLAEKEAQGEEKEVVRLQKEIDQLLKKMKS